MRSLNCQHRSRFARRGQFEQLESRLVLDGNPAIGLAEPYLTLSFAPDGTDVAGQPSELAAVFDQVAVTTDWQDAILRAFQTWAVHTNADIGLVADSGLPLGTNGATSRDLRFGDVRVAGVALPAEFGAISVSITSLVGGTWNGDVVFNTAFDYQSVDDIFAIALHEAGNVFGLLDNNDPNSPLNTGPIPTAIIPTAGDIDLLQALHGERAADINELEDDNEVERNDIRRDATDWLPIEVEGQPVGAFPALVYGDIQAPSDIDYFELDIPDGYTGSLTVQLRTSGVSLLRGMLTIENEQGTVLAAAAGTGVRGDLVSLTLPSVAAHDELYVRVEAAAADLYGVGGYSLIAIFDSANVATPAAIEAATNGSLRRIEVTDLANVFAIDEVRFAPDLGTNDALENATPLASAAGFVEGSRFEVLASVDQGDVDFYRLESAEYSAGDRLVVAVRSIVAGRVIPQAQVYDSLGNELSATVLANGGGELLLEVTLPEQASELVIRVAAANSSGPFSSGNYILRAGVMTQSTSLALLDSGVLADQSSEQVKLLYVAEPQLFHFVVDALPSSDDAVAAVEFVIRDAQGEVVYQLSAPAGTSRSSSAAFLPIGQYELVTRIVSLDPEAHIALDYAVRGRAFSDPFVGDGSDPTINPFVCEPGSGFYCYPGGIVSADPVRIEPQGTTRPLELEAPSTIETVVTLVGDWWNWVWSTATDNVAPLAVDDFLNISSAATTTGTIAPINLLDNDSDPDSDPMVAVVMSLPTRGEFSWNPNGTFSYRPDAGFVGTDSFSYVAFDFASISAIATVTIEVVGSDTLPGDYNADDVVDQLDYAVWRSQFGTAGGSADGNGDGYVDIADYTVWRDNLGRSRGVAMLASSPLVAALESAAPATGNASMLVGLDVNSGSGSRSSGTSTLDSMYRSFSPSTRLNGVAPIDVRENSNASRDEAFSQWPVSGDTRRTPGDVEDTPPGNRLAPSTPSLAVAERVDIRLNGRPSRR